MQEISKLNIVRLNEQNQEVPLKKLEAEKWNCFYPWLKKAYKESEVVILYRGTTISELEKRIKSKFTRHKKNPWMNYLFHVGEKPKSYIRKASKNNNFNRQFLQSIQDISDTSFRVVFDKLNYILRRKQKNVIHTFKKENPDFTTYFSDSQNKPDFISKIQDLSFLKKVKVRNYYLRLIHTIAEIGNYNEYSIFTSTSFDIREARKFSKAHDGIIIYFWRAKPLGRYGLSLEIVHDTVEDILGLELPCYFSEFYPSQKEFSLLGGLFPGNIIGYSHNENFVVNPNVVSPRSVYNENSLVNGFQFDDQEQHLTRLEKYTNYGWQVSLYDNLYFLDQEVSSS